MVLTLKVIKIDSKLSKNLALFVKFRATLTVYDFIQYFCLWLNYAVNQVWSDKGVSLLIQEPIL